ncbi:MAG TPA: hypothetical protein DCM68_05525 [Verrucomicrobia bacterium]|nr:hypothetical protein [Verrucomicrobiota bacterium]
MNRRFLPLAAAGWALISATAVSAQTVLLSNGFNSASLPAGWATNGFAAGAGTGIDPVISFVASSSYSNAVPYEGAYFAKFNSWDCRTNAQLRLAGPVMDASAHTNLSVQFAWFQDPRTGKDAEGATLQWTTNNWTTANSVTPFQMRRGTPTNWVLRHLALPPQAISTNLRVGLLFNSQYGNNCYADDFRVYASPPVADFPYSEDFDSGFGIWSCGPGADFTWTRWSGLTPSGEFPGQTTGVSSAQSGSYYLYTEASDPNIPTNVAMLEAPFDFSYYAEPRLSFYYHMCGASIGSLHVETSTNNGASWIPVWSKTGPQQADETDPWAYAEVVLTNSAWQPKVRIRFRGVTGTGGLGDMAIDSVSILNDLCGGLDSATLASAGGPTNGEHVVAGATYTKTWTMSNNGSTAWASNTLYSFAFGRGDNPASSSVVHFAAAESIAPGGTKDFSMTFAAPTNGGLCAGFWSLRHNGTNFGERVWLDVVVDTPDIAITNEQAMFASTVPTAGLGGTAHATVVGTMRWTNVLTGAGGTFAAASPWDVSGIALDSGDNTIVISGTNSAGVVGSATLVLTRLAAPTITIATVDATVSNQIGTAAVEGVAGSAAWGDLVWTNSLGGSGLVPASESWIIPEVALSVGTNLITVTATNAAGEIAFDSVQFIRESAAASGVLIDEPFDESPTPPPGWTFSGIAENYATVTNSGRAPPSVKFDDPGDYIVSPSFSGGTNVQFWMRANPLAGTISTGTFVVAQYAGGSWSTVYVATNPVKTGMIYSTAISESATQLKFTWDKIYGNIAFDDVIVNGTGSSTRVVLYSFTVGTDNDRVTIRWRTASEEGTVGFDVYRWHDDQWVKVNAEFIPALGVDGFGATYSVVDTNAASGGTYLYRLVEQQTNGLEQIYGPFERTATVLKFESPITIDEYGVVHIRWLGRADERYSVWRTTNLVEGFLSITSGIPAALPETEYLDWTAGHIGIYRIQVDGD